MGAMSEKAHCSYHTNSFMTNVQAVILLGSSFATGVVPLADWYIISNQLNTLTFGNNFFYLPQYTQKNINVNKNVAHNATQQNIN